MRTQAPENDDNLGAERRRYCTYLRFLLRSLLDPYSEYYSSGYLNSEGLTLWNNLVRHVASLFPELRVTLRRCLRSRDYVHVVKCLDIVIERTCNVCGEDYLENSQSMLKIYRSLGWSAGGEDVHSETA